MARIARILVISVLAFCCFQLVQSAENDGEFSNMKRVKDAILKGYDKHVRPGQHHSVTTTVNITLTPLYVIDLDEEKSLLTLDTWFQLTWIDERLKWTESDYKGVNEIRLADGYLWQPDIVVYNSHSSNIDPKGNTHFLAYPNGFVHWVPPATLTTVCAVVVSDDYPNDIQHCNITVGSWTHSGNQIDLRIETESGFDFSYFVNYNPRWEVLTELTNVTREVKIYDCCVEPYPSINARMSLKRRPPAHIQVIWSPCVLVMLLTLSLFWIPLASGKKITMGTILLLILTVMLVYVAGATKPPQAQIFAASFVRSTMYAVTAAILLEIFVINVGYTMGSWRPPHFLVHLLSGIAGKIICVWPPPSSIGVGDKLQLKEDGEQVEVPPPPRDEWILVATALDRLFFIIYIVVLAAIHRQ